MIETEEIEKIKVSMMSNPISKTDSFKDSFKDSVQAHRLEIKETVNAICEELYARAENHDLSKFTKEESNLFSAYFKKFKKTQVGSKEYFGFLEYLKPSIKIHYKRNRHHPQYFKRGMLDMNLIDLIEMLVDWKSIAKQGNNNILDLINLNQERFGYNDEIKELFLTTVRYFGWLED